MKRRIVLLIITIIAIKFGMGLYTNYLIKNDESNESFDYENINSQYNIYIADEIKTYQYFDDGLTGTFEKEATQYYYDGKIIIKDMKPFRKIIIKDFFGIEDRQITWGGDVTYNAFETVPRFYDDENRPNKEMKNSVEQPVIIYEVNFMNIIVKKYYVDKNVEYIRTSVYKMK